MKAEITTTTEIDGKGMRIHARGDVSTRPRFSYEQEITVVGRSAPEFVFKHPIPYYYSWDHSEDSEKTQEIEIKTVLNREFQEFPREIDVRIRQWSKKGHVWREIEINGEKGTQEIWYKEEWDHGELHKHMWVEWNRGEAKEEVHITEADGLRVRYFFRRAKQIHGPPGYFWFKSAEIILSDHPFARLFRFAINPEFFKVDGRVEILSQDFGYRKWPSEEWVKIAYDRASGTYWESKETIEQGEKAVISSEAHIETKKLKI